MFYVVSLQLNAASEMSKALKHFLKGKQRIRFGSCIDFIIDTQNVYMMEEIDLSTNCYYHYQS